jgi:hypothetical protein
MKEALYLRRVQVHRQQPVRRCRHQKIGNDFDEIGTRGLSLRSCPAYPKYGMTAVIRFAEAR